MGEENNLNIRVYGEKGGLEWHQREPNTLLVKWLDQPMQVYRTVNGYLGKAAAANSRTPPAHPEGYLEAFANIYRNFANAHPRRDSTAQAPDDDSCSTTRRSKTASAAWPSSKPWSASGHSNAAWTKLSV